MTCATTAQHRLRLDGAGSPGEHGPVDAGARTADGDGEGRPAHGGDALADSRAYLWLLRSLRTAWVCCALAVMTMLPALVLGSAGLVELVELGLLGSAGACATALALSVPVLLQLDSYVPMQRPTLGHRADVLVAALLADLLDPE